MGQDAEAVHVYWAGSTRMRVFCRIQACQARGIRGGGGKGFVTVKGLARAKAAKGVTFGGRAVVVVVEEVLPAHVIRIVTHLPYYTRLSYVVTS